MRARLFLLFLAFCAGAAASPADERALREIDRLHRRSQPDSLVLKATELVDRARRVGDVHLLLQAQLRLGRGLASFGRGPESEAPLREALALAVAQDDTASRLSALRWTSVALGLQDRIPEALAVYRELEALAISAADLEHQGWARVGFAFEAARRGDQESARRDYRRARECFTAAEVENGAVWALSGEAEALAKLRRFDEAVEGLSAAALAAREHGLAMVEAIALNNLADLEFSLGDPELARVAFGRSRSIHVEHAHRREAILAGLNLAVVDLALGEYERATSRLDSLRSDARRHGYPDLAAATEVESARAEIAAGRRDRARARLRAVLAAEPAPPTRTRRDAALALAAELAPDSLTAALDVLRRERRDEQEAGRTADPELSLALARLHLRAGALDAAGRALDEMPGGEIESAMRIEETALRARIASRAGRRGEALRWLEDGAERFERQLEVPLDLRWRERRSAGGRRIFPELVRLHFENGDLERAFAASGRFKARTLLERLRGPFASEGAAPAGPERTLDEFRRDRLLRDEVFVDATFAEEAVVLLAVSSDSVRAWVVQDPSGALARVHRFEELVRAGAPSDDLDRSGRIVLHDWFGPALGMLSQANTVWWCADGPLHRLVPEALPWPGGRGSAPFIARIPSAAVLDLLRSSTGRRPERARPWLAVAGSDSRGLLPGAHAEVLDVARSRPGAEVRLMTPGASGPTADDLQGRRGVHLAAHAVFDDRFPWHGALQFDGPAGSHRLRCSDLRARRLDVDLVVLSACATARGAPLDGGGGGSLADAFLAAGARTVVATVWPVDDAVTRTWMSTFHAALASGADVAESVARARDRVRGERATAHPRHWAGFVVNGEARVGVGD